MSNLISHEDGLRILSRAKDTFAGTDENGKPRYEYKLGGKMIDTNGNGIPEVDCSYMVYDTLQKCGYSVVYPNLVTRELNDLNPNKAGRYFEEVTVNDVREGDLIVFDGHVGIVEGIWYDSNLGDYVGTFFHSETSERGGAGKPVTSFFIYDANSENPTYWYGDERPITKFLRLKESIHNVMSYQQWFIVEHQRQSFTTAITAAPPAPLGCPLVLDLDGDGVETTNVADGAYFDHDANGFAEQTGWVSSDDGLLVFDRNGDGVINDGKELFGDQTLLKSGSRASNGFQALADLDDNKDGKIDANDSGFSQVKVWRDFDGDGYSSADELYTLNEIGITALNTGYTNSNKTDPNGNIRMLAGTFKKIDGTTSQMDDYSFSRDITYTIANEWLDVPSDIADLPDLQGYGNVYDLQQAMVRDTSGQLKSLVQQFIAATDPSVLSGLIDQILFKWTGSDGINPNSRGAYIDARKLADLEKFFGEGFVGVGGPNPTFNDRRT
jgi:hypothetical protein